MWKWLHPYAKAQTAYRLCNILLPYFAMIAVLSLIVGWVWGLGFAPADYQQKDSYRIIFIHVPSAILSMGAYSSMAIAAFIALVWQLKNAELAVIAIAPVGAAVTLIALITGAAWGKPMWGAWWVWDARLTTELILLFLYLGVISLYNAFEDKGSAGRASCILALVGSINLPIIHFSVEWWNTLHQGATITKFDGSAIDPSMFWPLMVNILAFSAFVGTVVLIRLKNEILLCEKHRPWVRDLVKSQTQNVTSEIGDNNAV
ncbi:heme ABC transporter permease [Pseudoalteromonas sp. NBT06-2]|uniref:heme ABC transporter permease n=1 Tax=Pseudoalteromonas sp. NBT06-2 TaxID=2025950 RepID=UPI000BA5E88B|nr:heme ABC transporter permease [Pseudoalteromonas sp. NBT06-2]PAJ74642.1 heme ABC transporter permease [Pseudoalteromonas sp. NBT06-2]